MTHWPKQLAQGSVVWASLQDPRGNVKVRPCVIVTATSDIVLDAPIVGAAVTTSYPLPPPDACVELPWYPRGHPATGLSRRSAVVCDWLVTLRPSDVIEIKGYVPTRTLAAMIDRIRARNDPSNPR